MDKLPNMEVHVEVICPQKQRTRVVRIGNAPSLDDQCLNQHAIQSHNHVCTLILTCYEQYSLDWEPINGNIETSNYN